MSADTLRRAASLMRERAEATTPDAAWTEGHYWIASYDMSGDPVQEEIGGMGGSGDAAHYSSWHPAVALAVADWLESVHSNLSTYNATTPRAKHAFAVARAYLGESA